MLIYSGNKEQVNILHKATKTVTHFGMAVA